MKTMLFSALLATCFMLTAQNANAQKDASEQDVRGWFDQAMATYFSGDVAKMVDLYADDVVLIDWMGTKTTGKAALKTAMEQQFAYEKPDPSKLTFNVKEVRFLSADCVHVTAYMKGSSQMGDQVINWESYDCFIIVRKNNTWKVIFEQMTGINPNPQGQN